MFSKQEFCKLLHSRPLSQQCSFSISISFLGLLLMWCFLSGHPWSLFLCLLFYFLSSILFVLKRLSHCSDLHSISALCYFLVIVEALELFKLGNGRRVAFWLDSWVDKIFLKARFPKLFQIAQCPNGIKILLHGPFLLEDF